MTLRFLAGGGTMGALMRGHDWSASKLGPPDAWPPQLKTLVGIMLAAPQAMFVAWGDERRMLYNNAYCEILGDHHPALDRPLAQVWSEIMDVIDPIMARAYAGEPTWMDDLELVMQRHGHPEVTYFSFFYSPVRDDDGVVRGVFCACTETTERVVATRERSGELERWREMFEQSPSFVAVMRGPEHRFELTNAAHRSLTGNRDLIGKPLREAMPELAGQGIFELFDEVYASGRPYIGRGLPSQAYRSADGPIEKRIFDLVYQPLRDAAGTVNGIFVEGVDVTQAHAQAQVLRDSEEKFRTFAQAMPNHVWTAPANGLLDWFNERTLVYSGLRHDDLVGTGWARIVHPDDIERAGAAWAASLAGGVDYEIEFRIRRADGAWRWHLVRALPIRNPAGDVLRWVGTNTDIDDQRADREALRTLNATLERRVDERTRDRERIWRNSPDLMVVADPGGTLQEVNPAWTAILGWNAGELVGRRIDALVHPDDVPAAEAALVRAGTGVLPQFECRMRHADGSFREIAWTAAPEGGVIFSFGRDITQAKSHARTLEQVQEQLVQSQKMESIGQLTGGIAHDFNNMLATVYGSIQLMQRRLATGQTGEFDKLLERAATSTQRAAALTQRLLAFARRQSLDIRRVDVQRLLASMEDLFVRTLGARVALKVEADADLWCARIDAGQLENALLNLVINASHAMPDGGELAVTAGNAQVDAAFAAAQSELNPGDYVLLSVRDSGTGMPASVIARAFEPFFTTKPLGQGTGLGLSMVYGFVKQAGGHVAIDSEPGRGTTVRLYLPRDASGSGSASVDEPAAEPPVPAASGAGETILVVEDEAGVRALVVTVLQELGYAYVETADAASALAVLDSGRHIDLLVTDVGLPGMNGRQLAEIACARHAALKVLFVTGYAEQAAARNAFLSERMQMITKPFDIDELAARIRTIITGAPLAQGTPS